MIQGTLTITWPKWERWISAAGALEYPSNAAQITASTRRIVASPLMLLLGTNTGNQG
jgi:hypothetical protein